MARVTTAARPGGFRFHMAWLPIPVLGAVMVALWIADPQASYQSQTLLLICNFAFSTIGATLVAILIGRSFLVRGVPELLLLSCGVAILGAAGTIAPILETYGANASVTAHNVLVCCAAWCHLTGALAATNPQRVFKRTGMALVIAYTGVTGIVGVAVMLTLGGWMPVFFAQGQGGTPIRQFVLGSTIAMFLGTAALLWVTRQRPLSAFLHWYGLALVVIAIGLFGVMIATVLGGALNWTGRLAQYIGGAYMLAAAFVSVRETGTWKVTLSAALSDARQTNERLFNDVRREKERLTALVNSITDEIWFADTEENFTLVNPSGAHEFALDMKASTPIRKLAERLEVLAPDGTPRPIDQAPPLRALRGEVIRNMEEVIRTPATDEMRYRQVSSSPVRDHSGTIIGSVSVARDITDLKVAEERIRTLNRELEQRVEARTAELRASEKKLRRLAAQLATAQDREQKRISELLHDDVAQLLVACSVKLAVAGMAGSLDAVLKVHTDLDALLHEAHDKLRLTSFQLGTATLYRLGLEEAIKELAESMQARHGIAIDVKVKGNGACTGLDGAASTILFKAVRELLFNVVKHAGTQQASVSLHREDGHLQIVVEDRGKGFERGTGGMQARMGDGLGLFGVRERMTDMGGSMHVESEPGVRTRITLTAPVSSASGSGRTGGGEAETGPSHQSEDLCPA